MDASTQQVDVRLSSQGPATISLWTRKVVAPLNCGAVPTPSGSTTTEAAVATRGGSTQSHGQRHRQPVAFS